MEQTKNHQKWIGTYNEANLTKAEVAAVLEGCLKTFREKAPEGKYNFILTVSRTLPYGTFFRLPQMEESAEVTN